MDLGGQAPGFLQIRYDAQFLQRRSRILRSVTRFRWAGSADRRPPKQHGFDIHELLGRRGKGEGSVAPEYRDPKNSENTWTGRGRMPRWLAAATKGGNAGKEDFLI